MRSDTLASLMRAGRALLITAIVAVASTAGADPAADDPGTAQTPAGASTERQSRADAWWTGPLLAPSPATLPQGHFLIEPYLFDAMPRGRYDERGRLQSVPHQNNFGSQSYVLYGLIDTLSIGLIPRFGYNDPDSGRSGSGPGVGDLTVQAQYRLTQFTDGGWTPTSAVVLQETLPTGKFDRLGDRPADGLGAGVYTTAVALYSQSFFWLPTGRILRARLDISYAFSASAPVHDVSVYGTPEGFAGRVRPGDSVVVDAAAEYSLTRNWVLALDLVYEHDRSTRISGLELHGASGGSAVPLELDSGASYSFSLAPALEYNFNSRVGIIAGTKLTVAGRNATAVLIPVAAINIVI